MSNFLNQNLNALVEILIQVQSNIVMQIKEKVLRTNVVLHNIPLMTNMLDFFIDGMSTELPIDLGVSSRYHLSLLDQL